MNKRITLITVFCLIFLMLFVSTGCKTSSVNKEDGISVVATNFPAYDFARNIVGDDESVTMLISPGNEVHSFEPTPKDMIKIKNCDLFICTGGESDEWAKRLLASKEYEDLNVLYMLDCVDAVNEEIKDGMDAQNEEDEPEKDEHVWTSPKNAVKITECILDRLIDIDKNNSEKYIANFEEYNEKLLNVDREFTELSNQIENKILIFADRFPFSYFAKEYGFDYFAAFPGCSSKTEPSSATIVFLINKVKEQNIPAVFTIEFSNSKLADTIKEETGVKSYELHSCHNVSKADFDSGIGYVELMQRNADTLRKAFFG